jgi:hypothetical protein
MARFDYAYDREAAQSAASLGLDPSQLLSVIDANEATIEKAGVTLHSYTAPGHGHGIFELAKVLRARGQRRKAGRLGHQADRARNGRRRALPAVPRRLGGSGTPPMSSVVSSRLTV